MPGLELSHSGPTAFREVSVFIVAWGEQEQQQEVHTADIKYAAYHVQCDQHSEQMAS